MTPNWEPRGGSRRAGRPVARWEDEIVRFASAKGGNWREFAQDRDLWSMLEVDFVKLQNE